MLDTASSILLLIVPCIIDKITFSTSVPKLPPIETSKLPRFRLVFSKSIYNELLEDKRSPALISMLAPPTLAVTVPVAVDTSNFTAMSPSN